MGSSPGRAPVVLSLATSLPYPGEPARVARPSSSVPTLTPRSSHRFPLSLQRSLMSGSSSFTRDCLARRTDALLTRSHSSSIYPSAVSLFVLLSLSFVVPSPLYSYSVSLFLPIRELHEQVLRSSPYRIPCPPPFLSHTMFHHSICNLSRARALRILQPADHIITLFIKPTATATIQSSSPPLSACRTYRVAFSGGGRIRSTGFNFELVLIPRFLSLLSFHINLIRLRLFPLIITSIRPEFIAINSNLEESFNDTFSFLAHLASLPAFSSLYKRKGSLLL